MGKVFTGAVWAVAVVLFLGVAGFITFDYVVDPAEPEKDVSKEETDDGGSDNGDSVEELTQSEEEFEVSDEVTQEGLPSEFQFSKDLHHMTHQKVEAAKKWGHLEITDQRLEDMHTTAKESDYEYRDFYIKVLENWQNNDFSNAVEVHNFIWGEQNGTVGRATGRMSGKEEMDYRNRHFD